MKEVRQIIDKNKEAMVIPDGIAVIGKDCSIIVFNEAASRITGFEEDDITGKHCDILFKDNPKQMEFIRESISENRAFTNLAVNISTKNGNYKNVLSSITPITKDGKVLSAVFVFRNTNEMLSMAEEIEAKTLELINQKNKLDAIFNSNIEGTFTIDDNWNITSFNQSAEKITGYTSSEAAGKKCWEIFNSNLCRNGCHMEETMARGKSTIGNELEITNKKGIKVPIRVNSGILKNDKNEKIGAVETFMDISEIKHLSALLDDKYRYENIIGKSKELKEVITMLDSVSQTNSTVLITGESGTGKELAAKAIHLNSRRNPGPFVAVNCSAFVESLIESELFGHEAGAFTGAVKRKTGRFELADNGTIFLDELGDLSPAVQTKLLRVLETKEFERVGSNDPIKMNARIIAATNKDLEKEIKEGRFREDLFYRINVLNIHIPPLRDRKDDLPLLVNHFIQEFNTILSKNIKQFSSSAYDVLIDYDWPGNIRELENVIEHAFILCSSDIIQMEHLPKRLRNKPGNNHENKALNKLRNKEQFERELILSTLDKTHGSRKQTAEELQMDTSTLWRKMKKYNLV